MLSSVVSLLAGCGGGERGSVALPGSDECSGQNDGIVCSAGVALTYRGGKVEERDNCALRGLSCADTLGCTTCVPFATVCDGDRRLRCSRDGTRLDLVETCAAGLTCSPGQCRDLCGEAAASRSYLGCEYWPVFSSNRLLDTAFRPAVAIGNGNLVPAHVVITKGEQVVAELDVAVGQSTTVELAYDDALRRSGGSTLVSQGAYRLRSSVPVTVHQFNPLLFELRESCQDPDNPKTGYCASFTNDASLLLPREALGLDPDSGDAQVAFLVASRASFLIAREDGEAGSTPGFVTVVAVGDDPVRVQVKTTAHTLASEPGGAQALAALAPGDTLDLTLSPGDVLQLLSAFPAACEGPKAETPNGTACDPGADYDLTGTEIRADGPIEVLSGHDCANVPFDRVACDHLEESLTPLRTWGTSAVLTHPEVHGDAGTLLRVLSGADDNEIRFEPEIAPPRTLERGQWMEFATDQPVLVSGTGRLLVAQYLVGQGSAGGTYVGDPSLSLAVPRDQYRASYDFLSPGTYTYNYADLIVPSGDVITLDGTRVCSFAPIGTTGYGIATVPLTRPGAHVARSTRGRPFGIVLYGLAAYTSYMLPGGLDLRPLGTGI